MKNNEFENIEIPDNIDLFIKNGLNKAIEDKKFKIKKRPFKVAVIAASISALTITTAFGIDGVLKYFKNNSESRYSYDKSTFKTFGQEVNITSESNEISFTLDNMAIDDSYINIFFTVKSDKNIKALGTINTTFNIINIPIPNIIVNEKQIIPSEKDVFIVNDSYAQIQKEGAFINDNEMVGMVKFNISNSNIENGANIDIKLDNIFGVDGNWEINTNINKTIAQKQTHSYDINKSSKINLNYYDINSGKDINVEHSIDIQKVIVSPFGNNIVIKESADKKLDYYIPSINNRFALFDDHGKSLDIISGLGNLPDDKTKSITNTYEILGMNKNIESLNLVPIQYDDSTSHVELEPQSIESLPVIFETSKHGKIIVEDIEIKEDGLKLTYYKEGVTKKIPITFHDENGVDLQLGGYVSTSINRQTGRYTKIYNLKGYEEELSKLKKIRNISTFSDLDFELLYDQQVKIDLKK